MEKYDNVGKYFKELCKNPLLTREEELDSAKIIDDLTKKIKDRKISDRERRKAEKESIEQRDKLIKHSGRLVISIAKNYSSNNLDRLDIIQAGLLGLMKAAEKFHYEKKCKFSTYATYWIKQAITREISNSGIIRIPVYLREKIGKINRAAETLRNKYEREPTVKEIIEETGISPKVVEKALRYGSPQIRSSDTPLLEGDGDEEGYKITLADTLYSKEESPDEFAKKSILKEKIESILSDVLDKRERKIFYFRYGLKKGYGMTLEEVGKEFGLTRERIRQIQEKALCKLRKPKNKKRLEEIASAIGYRTKKLERDKY